METILDRFLDYVRIDTQSQEDSKDHPSTPGQMTLAKLIRKQLVHMGITSVSINPQGYVTAYLPANTDLTIPNLGLIAHLDTSPDISGHNVLPQVHRNYQGGDIILNKPENVLLNKSEFPELDHYIGHTLITSDGTTLLGADNKAGIAIIMGLLEHLTTNTSIPHGKISVAFTTDEEIGRGADFFDVVEFGADWAYTVDGGPVGELEFENFNAASAAITIHGINVHPGSALGRMKNALLIAMELNALLPQEARPEFTQGYQGFYHLNHIEGGVETALMKYIIRDHDHNEFQAKKDLLQKCVADLNAKYGGGTLEINLKDQYYNMREKIEPVMHVIEIACQAMQELEITPLIKPIRGGTDGARLSFLGLPCPNLFTGGHNYHSRYEFISLESMQSAVQVLLKIVEIMVINEVD